MGFAGNAALFDRIGYTPGIFWGTLVGCTELIGGISAGARTVHPLCSRGRTDLHDHGGALHLRQGLLLGHNGGIGISRMLIGFCAFFFLIRGGGNCSIDRMIGREI